ncbi:ABC transporter permease subunit [Mycoplasmopsis felifaucium]|uniref:Sugar ABC transporter permease n=1 Tax=Mycoplasmopsis felifaucium TaxID=35768 RepID=A0ABZ2RS55_9BACT
MQNKLQAPTFSEKVRKFFMMDSTKKSERSIFNSLWAVFFGILISSLFIGVFYQENPFAYFATLFDQGFSVNQTALVYIFIVYGVASIGVGFAFKSGLFNIGVSGQMAMAGIASILIFSKAIGGGVTGGGDGLGLGLLLLSMLIGFIYSAIAGALKAYFKIHEVVTTILLNWVTVFIAQFFFNKFNLESIGIATNDSGRSNVFTITGVLFNKDNFWIFGLVFLVILAAGTFVVMQFTSLGYKIKMNGLNKDASTYAGVNQKLTTILVMGFSGALAGFAGFTYFFIYNQGMEGAKFTQPILIGFDTIAIALLGMNSSIGILVSSIFYASLQNGANNIAGVQEYTSSTIVEGGDKIVVGIILYVAALSGALSNFKPVEFIKTLIAKYTQKSFKEYRNNNYLPRIQEIKREYRVAVARAKALKQYNSAEYKAILKEIKEHEKLVVQILQTQSKFRNNPKFAFDEAKFKVASEAYNNVKNRLVQIEIELDKLGYYEIQKLNREKAFHIETSKIEYQYETTNKEFLSTLSAIDNHIKAEYQNIEMVQKLKAQKLALFEELKAQREASIKEFSSEFDLKIVEASKVIEQNKQQIDTLLAEKSSIAKQMKNLINDYVHSFKLLSSREIEAMFSELSKAKISAKEKLDELGYSQIEDIKLLSKAKLAQAKVNYNKRVKLAVDRYDFLSKVVIGSLNINVSTTFLDSVEAKIEKLKVDYLERYNAGEISQQVYENSIASLDEEYKTFCSYDSVALMLNKRHAKLVQKELVSVTTEKDKLKNILEQHNIIYEKVKNERKWLKEEYSKELNPAKFDQFRSLYEHMVKIERGGQ